MNFLYLNIFHGGLAYTTSTRFLDSLAPSPTCVNNRATLLYLVNAAGDLLLVERQQIGELGLAEIPFQHVPAKDDTLSRIRFRIT